MPALTLLAVVLAIASCSRSGDTGSPAQEIPTPAAQATAAGPAATPSTGKESPAPEPQDTTDAPELRPENAGGAVRGIPAPTNTVPIVAVANYFTELPGIDVAGLKRGQKEKFLQRVNSEICSCGCKNDTLARCYVNDPRCPLVKSMVQKVYAEVKAGR